MYIQILISWRTLKIPKQNSILHRTCQSVEVHNILTLQKKSDNLAMRVSEEGIIINI